MAQRDIEHGGSKRDAGIELFLEHEGDALTEHIAQHAAKDAGDNGRNHGDNRAFAHIERDLRPDNRKYHQAKCIQHQKQAAQMGHYRGKDCGQHRGDSHDDHILRVLHPAERIVAKQDIAHRTAAKRRRGSNNNDAKGVHTTSPGGQRAGHGFGSDADQIENV